MNTAITEEQTMLQDSVKKFVENELNLEKVRELFDEPNGLTDELWNAIAEQGWLGILVPEENGGMGMGVQELAVVCEELGRGVVPGPFLSTVLAAHLIALAGTDAAKQAWLENIVAGQARATLALIEDTPEINLSQIGTKAVKDNGGYLLNGKKLLVADALGANVFVVAARKEDGALAFFLVDRSAGGVTVKENKLRDLTARSGNIYLENVSVDADAVMDSGAEEAYQKVLNVANVCIAADCLGGADYIHKLTVAYAKERTQFGTLIGSFQAVKHPLVDLFAQIESARSANGYAAWAVDADVDDVNTAAAVARNTGTQAYRDTTNVCLQAHGGIAFTWEYDLHIFLKRAKHNQFLYGSSSDADETICREALGI